MDKYELNKKIDKIKRHYSKQNYAAAVKLADEIDFKGLKDWKTLALMINLYEAVGRPQDVRYFCVLAYNRNLGGRKLLYKLAKVNLGLNDLDEAEDIYEEFSRTAGNDSKKLELKFELRKAQGAELPELIDILEELDSMDMDDKYGYILAYLYSKNKQYEKCVQTCDKVIETFVEGDYVEKAKELKSFHVGVNKLTEQEPAEQKPDLTKTKVFHVRKSSAELSSKEPVEPVEPVEMVADEKLNQAVENVRQSVQEVIDNAKRSVEETYREAKKEVEMDDIQIKVPDNTRFDTRSLQDTIAKGVSDCIEEALEENVFKVRQAEPEEQTERIEQTETSDDGDISAFDEEEVYVEDVEEVSETDESVSFAEEDQEVKAALYMVEAALAKEAEPMEVPKKPSVDDTPTNKISVRHKTYEEVPQDTIGNVIPISIKRHFAKYNNIAGLTEQIEEFLLASENESEQKMGTSCVGNLIVSGNRSSDKKQLAINVVKAMNDMDGDRIRKIATTSGDSINQRGIAKSIGKIAGAALIIEEAGNLEKRRVDELLNVMQQDTDEMLVILEDSESEINQLMSRYPELEHAFNHRIVYKQYNVNELVEMCKRYADKQNFLIDDKAMFLLYSRIDQIHAREENVNLEEIRAVVDGAIDKAEKRAGRILFGGVKKKKVDDREFYILVESDFKE